MLVNSRYHSPFLAFWFFLQYWWQTSVFIDDLFDGLGRGISLEVNLRFIHLFLIRLSFLLKALFSFGCHTLKIVKVWYVDAFSGKPLFFISSLNIFYLSIDNFSDISWVFYCLFQSTFACLWSTFFSWFFLIVCGLFQRTSAFWVYTLSACKCRILYFHTVCF